MEEKGPRLSSTVTVDPRPTLMNTVPWRIAANRPASKNSRVRSAAGRTSTTTLASASASAT